MSKDSEFAERRQLLAAACATLAAPTAAAAANPPLVTLFGDSITAGYGLPAKDALPAQLDAALRHHGVTAQLHAAGVSGDTTASGLRRVDKAVPARTRLCVVALGGNDLLQFLPPAATRQNLDAIVKRLRAKGMSVVLAGIQAPAQLGGYAQAFNGAFAEVAKAHRAVLFPDLLGGVMLNDALNQPDGVHPNARGVRIIADRLAPIIAANLGPARHV